MPVEIQRRIRFPGARASLTVAMIRQTEASTSPIIHQYRAHPTTISVRTSCARGDQPSATDVRIASVANTATTNPIGITTAVK